jgi:hypothetical protein
MCLGTASRRDSTERYCDPVAFLGVDLDGFEPGAGPLGALGMAETTGPVAG